MVEHLKGFIDEGKVLFGIKQSLKHSSEIERVIVPNDCRDEIIKLLKVNKIAFEVAEYSKEEIASRLNTRFKCEVFGVRK